MHPLYLNYIRRILLLVCVGLTVTAAFAAARLRRPVAIEDVEKAKKFKLPNLSLTESASPSPPRTKPLYTYKPIWTKPLRKDLNPPKPKVVPKPAEPKLPTLTGIIFEPDSSFALFLGDNGQMILRGEGEELGVFVLSAILPNGVQLSFGEKSYELKLPKHH